MKTSTFLLIAIAAILSSLVYASDAPRYVVVGGYDTENPVGTLADYNDTLFYAIYGDTTGRAENPNTIYVLQRNCIYPLGKQITNYNYHLQIMGEEGEGLLPEIVGSTKSDGTYGLDFIKSYNDLTLKSIYINGELPSSYQHWVIEMYGNGSGNTYTLDNVAMVYDRAAAICVRGDSLTINIKNSVLGNTGTNNAANGNGRMIDIRPEAPYVKSITVENCITFNHSDRIIRHMAGEIGYLSINHLTAVNTLGMNGALQMGMVREAHITNNIFANTICLGEKESRNIEQQQADHKFAVITLDSNFVEQGQIIDIRSNNIFWDDIIKNQAWALYPDVSQPNYICSTTTAALGDKASASYFSEPLTFGKVSSTQALAVWVATYYSDPNSESLPDSWTIPANGGLYYDEFDISYSATSQSATAGTDGGAVGCSPIDFSRGISMSIKENKQLKAALNISVSPNPFTNYTTIEFVLAKNSNVNCALYSLDGKFIKTITSQNMGQGTHQIQVDATDLSRGLYFYSLQLDDNNVSGQLIVK